ncbi:MAG: MFS transporter, partial [Cyclobacteriaceae bacterium]
MKNRQALILLFTANAISGFAQGVSMLAIPWYFAQQNNSSQFNLIFGIVTFANIFWGLYAGTLVDRFPRKSLFLGTNIFEGATLLFIALAGWSMGSLPIGLIVLAFAVTVFGYRIHYPNLYAFAQEITSPEHYTKVTSYIEIVGQATNVLAGALAVVLLEGLELELSTTLGTIAFNIDAWEIHEIFTLDAITYFVSVAIIYFIRYIPDKKFEADRGALWSRLNSGFKWLKDHPLVFTFGFFTHSIFVVMLVSLFAVMPLYITNYLESGGEVFGIMEVLYGIGALMAGIFISRWTQRFSKVGAIIWLMFLTTF